MQLVAKPALSIALLALGVGLVAGCRRPDRQDQSSAPSKSAVTQPGDAPAARQIVFSFLLDPRLTRGMYMGDRWVSPPTYTTVRPGKQASIQVKARVLDAKSRWIDAAPEWSSADPAIVSVAPSVGRHVTLTVHGPGTARVMAVSPGVSGVLTIKAAEDDAALRIDISPGLAPTPMPDDAALLRVSPSQQHNRPRQSGATGDRT